MAISYVANRELEFDLRTSMEVEKPAGSQAGDVLLIWPYLEAIKTFTVTQGEAAANEVTPTGKFSTFFQAGCYVAVHDGTSSTLKITWGGGLAPGLAVVEAYRGVDTSTPIDVTGTFVASPNATFVAWGSITTVTNGAWQVGFEVNDSSSTFKETPSGWTERLNTDPSIYTRERATAGETGNQAFNLTAVSNVLRMTLALRPASEEAEPAARPVGLLMGVGR